jgi:hypothetical protein
MIATTPTHKLPASLRSFCTGLLPSAITKGSSTLLLEIQLPAILKLL